MNSLITRSVLLVTGLCVYPSPVLAMRSNVRKSFFSERVVNVWNFLPADTVDFSSLSILHTAYTF